MPISKIHSYADSSVRHFMASTWKEKAVQILCAGSCLLLIYYFASRFIKKEEPPLQDPPSIKGRVAKPTKEPVNPKISSIPTLRDQNTPDMGSAVLEPEAPIEELALSSIAYEDASIRDVPNELMEHIFLQFDAEELDQIPFVCKHWYVLISNSKKLTYEIPLPTWLKDISHAWEKVDLKKYRIDVREAPRINKRALTKRLKALSKHVEKNMGITNMVIPKGLTLNIALQIAKDYSVPISPDWFDQILTQFGDIPAEQTCERFFTNSILTGTRKHTSEQHTLDVEAIGKECGIAVQKPQVRDFIAFLVLTYLNSPEAARTLLYSSLTYTRLLEKVGHWSLIGGCAPSGLGAIYDLFDSGSVGVGASGSSEDIGTRNIGT